MTGMEAVWIAQAAQAAYGDLVEVSVTTRRVGGIERYQVWVLHKLLGRRIAVVDVEDWLSIKQAWAALLEQDEEVCL